jgi:hypothetical protein
VWGNTRGTHSLRRAAVVGRNYGFWIESGKVRNRRDVAVTGPFGEGRLMERTAANHGLAEHRRRNCAVPVRTILEATLEQPDARRPRRRLGHRRPAVRGRRYDGAVSSLRGWSTSERTGIGLRREDYGTHSPHRRRARRGLLLRPRYEGHSALACCTGLPWRSMLTPSRTARTAHTIQLAL